MNIKTDKSQFSYWHKQCMRMRLNSYKLICGYGWLGVAEDIICSKSNDLNFPETSDEEEDILDEKDRKNSNKKASRPKPDTGWPIQAQDLLRFVNGEKNKETGKREPRGTGDEKLIPVCDFLIDSLYLPTNFLELRENELIYNTIYSLIDYLNLSNKDNSDIERVDLSGDYKHEEKKDKLLTYTELEFFESPDEFFYSVSKKINLYKLPHKKLVSSRVLSGWAIWTNRKSESLIVFLKNISESDNQIYSESQKVLSIFGIKSVLGKIQEIALNELSGALLTEKEDDIRSSEKIFNSMIFNRFYEKPCFKYDKNANVVSIKNAQKDKTKTMSFGTGNSAANKWKSYQQMAPSGKDQKMDEEDTIKKFFKAAYHGLDWEVAECVDAGVDINHEDPKTKIRAIHLVAAHNAVPAFEVLKQSSNLEYFAPDAKGQLPSHHAWVSGNNPALGSYLQKKEKQEAEVKNIDYESFIKNNLPS
ncbi:MAG: hypothetical protein ACRBBR_06655 [Cellvibrionaceae bacterium]